MLQITSFIKTEAPVTEPVTKFGGQPVWLDGPQWPIGRTRGLPMQFVCQIELRPEEFGGLPGRMAYLFIDQGGLDEDDSTCFWDAQGGDNAVIVQPGGTCSIETVDIASGPTLSDDEGPCEYLVELEAAEDPPGPFSVDSELDEEALEQISSNKIGGAPYFWDAVEYPDDGEWLLLLQLNEDLPFAYNCCLGMCYAFLSKDGTRGAYFCQSG